MSPFLYLVEGACPTRIAKRFESGTGTQSAYEEGARVRGLRSSPSQRALSPQKLITAVHVGRESQSDSSLAQAPQSAYGVRPCFVVELLPVLEGIEGEYEDVSETPEKSTVRQSTDPYI